MRTMQDNDGKNGVVKHRDRPVFGSYTKVTQATGRGQMVTARRFTFSP
jgi:hypothetical protein